jgi:hypothetical protein
MTIEYANRWRVGIGFSEEDRRVALRNAPPWVLRQVGLATAAPPASAPTRPRARPRPIAKPVPARRWAGWVAGCCAPGVSTPGYSSRDGERLPEQFTMNAWRSVIEQVQKRGAKVKLTWGHDGPLLARGPIDLALRLDPFWGLQFQARLLDTALHRRVLSAAGKAGLPCSIGYVPLRQSIVTRDGVGRMRIVDDCQLDHVAILVPEQGRVPVFSGARCFGQAGQQVACPRRVLARAQEFVAPLLLRQVAGARL